MKGQFFNYKNEEVWEVYKAIKVEEGKSSANIAQYKCAALALDKVSEGENFNSLNFEQVIEAKSTLKKKDSHFNGFVIDCISNDICNFSQGALFAVLPVREREAIQKVLG